MNANLVPSGSLLFMVGFATLALTLILWAFLAILGAVAIAHVTDVINPTKI
jgi:hypothetical protein